MVTLASTFEIPVLTEVGGEVESKLRELGANIIQTTKYGSDDIHLVQFPEGWMVDENRQPYTDQEYNSAANKVTRAFSLNGVTWIRVQEYRTKQNKLVARYTEI